MRKRCSLTVMVLILAALQIAPGTGPEAGAISAWYQDGSSGFNSTFASYLNCSLNRDGNISRIELDQVEGDWTNKTYNPFPHTIWWYVMSSIWGSDKVILFGGMVENNSPCCETWIYDAGDDNWTNMETIGRPSGITGHAMSMISGSDKVICVGGWVDSREEFTYVYDLNDKTWSKMNPTTGPTGGVRGPGLAPIYNDDKVVMYGGEGYNDTWVYDLSDNTWYDMNPPTNPWWRYLFGMASVYNDDKIVLCGGANNFWECNNDTWVYDLSENRWYNMSAPVPMAPGYGQHLNTIYGDDKILLVHAGETWVYDLSDNQWTRKNTSKCGWGGAYEAMAPIYSTDKVIFHDSDAWVDNETWIYNLMNYMPCGTYTSPPFDTGGPSSFKNITGNATVPVNTSLSFQVRTGVNKTDLLGKNFTGPSGRTDTYYCINETFWPGYNEARWVQYRAYLCTTNVDYSPMIYNLTLNYNRLSESPGLIGPSDGLWTNDSRPTFSWTFNDDDSACAGYELVMDVSPLFDTANYSSDQNFTDVQYYRPAQPINDGTWYWKVRTRDADGDMGPFSPTQVIHIDTGPPEPFQPTASPSGWTNGTIQLSYETTDTFAGMDHYEIEIAGVSQGVQGSPFTLPPLSDGEHNITVKAFDKVSNQISTQVKVYQDRTPPLGFTPTAEPSGWTNTSPKISFETTDATSGIERYQVAVDGCAFSCQTSPYTLPKLSDGQHNITVRAYDTAGNYADAWVKVYIDNSMPFNFSIIPEIATWTNRNANISFEALDNESAIDHFEVKLPGGDFTVQTSPYKLPDFPDGRQTIIIRVYDKALNYVEMSVEVLVDKTPPADFTPIANPPSWTNKNPKVNFTTTDNTSGVNRYEVGIDGGQMSFSTSPFTVPNLTDGEHQVVVRAYDTAGNYLDKTVQVFMDKTVPGQLVLKINDGAKSTGKRTVSLNMLASDANSGLDTMAFSNDGIFFSDWEPYSSSKSWLLSNGTGNKVVYFKVKDKAGNEATVVTQSIKYSVPATVSQDNSLLIYLVLGLIIISAVVVVAWRVSRKSQAGTAEGAVAEEKAREQLPEEPVEEEAPPEALPVAVPVAEKPRVKAAPEAVPVPLKVKKAPPAPAPAPPRPPVAIAKAVARPSKPPAAAPEGFAVEDIFLMYRDGRLIHHSTRRLKADMDVDVVTSMLTAVQEFVKESFGKAEGQELGSMEFGDSKIMLQKGKYVILAAVISGPETPGFRDELKTAIRNIEGEFGAVLPDWNGMTATLAGARKFLTSLGTYQPVAAAPAKAKEEVSLKAELEFYQGFVRLKVAVKNSMPTFIMGTVFKPIFSEKALKLYSIEPEYDVKGDEILLGNVEPNEKKTVALYLDPQICTESYIEGVLTYKDAHGSLETVKLPRKLASVVCPILYTDENINTAMLKRMSAEELDKKDTKVFSIPPNMTPQKAFEIAKGAAQHHDLRQVREYTEKDPYIGEAWYYGKAKGRNERLVVRARVIAEKNVLEFYVASDSVLMLTGMLAELKTDLRKEMEVQKLRGGMSQVTDQGLVDTLASIKTLMEKAQ